MVTAAAWSNHAGPNPRAAQPAITMARKSASMQPGQATLRTLRQPCRSLLLRSDRRDGGRSAMRRPAGRWVLDTADRLSVRTPTVGQRGIRAPRLVDHVTLESGHEHRRIALGLDDDVPEIGRAHV